ncbi:MAG: hypothetical protein GY745_18820 [Actinomycetia bacterium]|nr:hypothetical protein [Actinomycetes bacterium]MCP4087076.1 hypothetical protein [Actinomycetes bacterium]
MTVELAVRADKPNRTVSTTVDEVDEQLTLHELSHVWFNDSLFDQRWITEGLADEVAYLGDSDPEDLDVQSDWRLFLDRLDVEDDGVVGLPTPSWTPWVLAGPLPSAFVVS